MGYRVWGEFFGCLVSARVISPELSDFARRQMPDSRSWQWQTCAFAAFPWLGRVPSGNCPEALPKTTRDCNSGHYSSRRYHDISSQCDDSTTLGQFPVHFWSLRLRLLSALPPLSSCSSPNSGDNHEKLMSWLVPVFKDTFKLL